MSPTYLFAIDVHNTAYLGTCSDSSSTPDPSPLAGSQRTIGVWHRRQDGRVEERYERYSEGHLERMLDLLTDDFVWVATTRVFPARGGMSESRRRSTSFSRSVRMTSMSDR